MAKYLSTHTGEEIDTAVTKTEKLPTLAIGDSGKHIMVTVINNAPYMTAQEVYSFNTVTLDANSWTEVTQTAYTQTLTSVKQAGDNVRVSPAQTWTGATDQDVLANIEAIADANIYRIVEANSGTGLTFTCETKPSVNIKVLIEVYK